MQALKTFFETIHDWNSGAEKIFGYTKEEILGQNNEILFTPEDRQKVEPQQEIQTAIEKGKAEDERWHIRKDSSRFYASGIMQPLKDGGIEGFVKIARDLHDEFGQKLTALRLTLETTKKISEPDEITTAGLDEAQLLAKQIDDGVDFLAWKLRPVALDDLGLVTALKKYIREWSNFSTVPGEFHTSGLKNRRLLSEVETNLYRIAQETLNNVYKHANAKRAEISLESRDDFVILIIEDDGKGFNVKNKKNRDNGIGLIGMQERVTNRRNTRNRIGTRQRNQNFCPHSRCFYQSGVRYE